jgi:hypothetical protein
MNLNKDVSSWAVVKADAVMAMSPAAIQNVLTMALEDIQRLGRDNENLQARVDRWEPTIGARASMLGRSR